jgi:hypothetical protein
MEDFTAHTSSTSTLPALITTSTEPRNEWADKIVRSANGDLWVIVRQDVGGAWQVNLYRSNDQGNTWTLVGSAGQFAQFQESTISIDSQDRIHIAWVGDPGTLNDVYYNSYDISSGQWRGAIALATGGLHQAPGQILVTATDKLYVFWFTATTTRINYKWSADRGATWSAEQSTSDLGMDVGSYHARAVADSTGKIHLVVGRGVGDAKRIAYLRFDDGNWSDWVQLSDTGTVAEGTNIAVDSTDALYVVWSEQVDGHYQVRFRKSNDGGSSWSAITTIYSIALGGHLRTADYLWPKVVVAPNSTLFVTFSDMASGLMYYVASYDAGATWTQRTEL